MAIFSIDSQPDLDEFGLRFQSSRDILSVSNTINNFVGLWNRFSFAEYRNFQFFRYRIFTISGRGVVRVTYPNTSGPQTDYTTPFYRLGNPPFITIQANAQYGWTFNGWYETPGGTFISSSNPFNLGGSQTTSAQIYALFV